MPSYGDTAGVDRVETVPTARLPDSGRGGRTEGSRSQEVRGGCPHERTAESMIKQCLT